MDVPERWMEGATRILDLGGWFRPEPRATHVVDLMPWETRGGRLTLDRRPGEHFSRETWHQADFLVPGFRLPFPDRAFDLVLCGDTVEDLADPGPLLAEMDRVGRAGWIESPSRLAERTVGLRDRATDRAGHPHHHWIVESDGGTLRLWSKADSGLSAVDRTVPLDWLERRRAQDPAVARCRHGWRGRLRWERRVGPECAAVAGEFVAALGISASTRAADRCRRALRRLRSRLRRSRPVDRESWWNEMLVLSRPYDRLHGGTPGGGRE
jgi:SAM-dependent methyltransferase